MQKKPNLSDALGVLGLGLIFMNLGKKAIGANYLRDKVVFITGGTTGLGFILANKMAEEGAKIAICARDEEELARAKAKLLSKDAQAIAIKCDVSSEEQVEEAIEETVVRLGKIDILINNAGIIQVGAMESFEHKDYKKAMDVMYWGVVNTTYAAARRMKMQGSGHIVNITSVGGKVSIPHLLPYNASKFAAVGFSEGITAELAKDNIHVTTIVPGLMRTGSFVNAKFEKNNKKEFRLFSTLMNVPLLTLSAERAADKIITAIKEKRDYQVLGVQTKILIQFNNLFPRLTPRLFSLVNRILPKANSERGLESGRNLQRRSGDGPLSHGGPIGKKAQERFQDYNNGPD